MIELGDAAATVALGERLATLLVPGDLVIVVGELGAGKTTLTQGVGAGLGVRGPVVSPTFIIARTHPSEVGGPPLIHVDAYRLGSLAELDDLDLDASLEESVTVVEWGEGMAEVLAPSYLTVRLDRGRGAGAEDGRRTATIDTNGPRWSGTDVAGLLEGQAT